MRDPYLQVIHNDEEKMQLVYRFPNGYGASVVQGPTTDGGLEGLWELAVIRFNSTHPCDFTVDESTALGTDTHGDLTQECVEALLVFVEHIDSGAVSASA